MNFYRLTAPRAVLALIFMASIQAAIATGNSRTPARERPDREWKHE